MYREPNPAFTQSLQKNEILRDLAIFRASDIDLSKLIPDEINKETRPSEGADAVEAEAIRVSTERSYEFVKETRAVLDAFNRGDPEAQGKKIEEIQSKLEEVIKDLSSLRP
ncbi:hypothetical protein SERLA73DRAFT_179638 [Serpula lacrymans var. lacrymans S7.3]|uniref:Uncharacterized protein n=2 Tax=Serpula lacrymans var. lacrymans TaxID=341189 RepID=F8PVW3_SERL3|nr:uncharacterized protein SERLADRAFT_464836 [Serpula lacrymans var. lacrymans S7.9]EGN99559.1 hypothetical protein SERLA73DRAFT_179638 [Serpula lacrymans var. lacrymans S7.3]EGO25129.1 hypothetical protein SERLADRAFT_464836 [Serpula lacrymans var. lacrymans S7.9]